MCQLLEMSQNLTDWLTNWGSYSLQLTKIEPLKISSQELINPNSPLPSLLIRRDVAGLNSPVMTTSWIN